MHKLRSFVKNREFLEAESSELPSSSLPYDNEFIDALKIIQVSFLFLLKYYYYYHYDQIIIFYFED